MSSTGKFKFIPINESKITKHSDQEKWCGIGNLMLLLFLLLISSVTKRFSFDIDNNVIQRD